MEGKKLMTNRQLAELMAKGYGEWSFNGEELVFHTEVGYGIPVDDEELEEDVFIRPWGMKELLKPTVDIYEEYVSKWNRAFKEIEVKVVFPKKEDKDTIKDYSDCGSVEPKIGEVFRYKGLTLRCEEGGCGDGCALAKLPCYAFECMKDERKDGKGVHFVDVSKKENTTASEDSSATVSKEESVGVHRRTPQEFADFFNCYVAMDEDGYWYLYSGEPILGKDDMSWKVRDVGTGDILSISKCFLLLNAEEDHNWKTLYRPHKEPIVMEGEDD